MVSRSPFLLRDLTLSRYKTLKDKLWTDRIVQYEGKWSPYRNDKTNITQLIIWRNIADTYSQVRLNVSGF